MASSIRTCSRISFTATRKVSQISLPFSHSVSCRNLLPTQSLDRRLRAIGARPFTHTTRVSNVGSSKQTNTTSVSKENVDQAKDDIEQSRYQVLNEESPYKEPEHAQGATSGSSTRTDTTSVSKSDVDTANDVAEQTPPYQAQSDEPRLSLTFTCTVPQCNTRSSHEFTKRSYERGIVIVQCPGCKNRHLIADHLGWFKEGTKEGTLKTVEDLMRAKGEKVRRGSTDGSLTIEYAPE